MDCKRIDLVAYHFATDADEERRRVEEHLLGCRACLATYLALKRTEEDRAHAERPGPEVRLRLRRDVERAFRPVGWRPAWWTRPVPLYKGLAVAGLALLVAVVAPSLARRDPPLHEAARVDTSRPFAESLGIF
jgi:hypothetical protein